MSEQKAVRAGKETKGGEAKVQTRSESFPSGAGEELLALQNAAGNQAVHAVVASDSGQPLDPATRVFMEARFGEEFGRVRVHTGAQAAAVNAALNATAYTVGQDIVMAGRYEPHTSEGRQLLAHELTHVVQQNREDGGAITGDHEAEASAAARAVTGGGEAQVHLSARAGAVQFQEDEETRISVIPDPQAHKLRVVRLDRQGRIVAGLAEISPPPGVPLDQYAIDVNALPSQGSSSQVQVAIPEEYEGTINPVQDVTLVSEPEIHEAMAKAHYEQLRQNLMLYAREQGDEFGLGSNLAAEYLRASNEDLEKAAEEIGYDKLRNVRSYYDQLRKDLIEYEKHKAGEVAEEFGIRIDSEEEAKEKYGSADLPELKMHASEPEFREWRSSRDRAQHHAAEKRKGERIHQLYGGAEFGLSVSEARGSYEGDEAKTLRDEETGELLGTYGYKTSEKYLGGAVGTVTEELHSPEGYLLSSRESTVLTPTAEVIQDVVRNAPYVGQTIAALEAASGVSLNLRDYGRMLSAAERGDRAVSVLPYAGTVKAATEATLGLSLSFTDYGRVLSDQERKERIAQVGTDLMAMGVGKAQGRQRAQQRPKQQKQRATPRETPVPAAPGEPRAGAAAVPPPAPPAATTQAKVSQKRRQPPGQPTTPPSPQGEPRRSRRRFRNPRASEAVAAGTAETPTGKRPSRRHKQTPAATGRSRRPSDPYDKEAWAKYYEENPGVGRSVGAAAVDDPVVAGKGDKRPHTKKGGEKVSSGRQMQSAGAKSRRQKQAGTAVKVEKKAAAAAPKQRPELEVVAPGVVKRRAAPKKTPGGKKQRAAATKPGERAAHPLEGRDERIKREVREEFAASETQVPATNLEEAAGARLLSPFQAHALMGSERHHPVFKMLLRAFHKAGVSKVVTAKGRLRPQKLVDLPTSTHQEAVHQFFDDLVKAQDEAAKVAGKLPGVSGGLARGKGASDQLAQLMIQEADRQQVPVSKVATDILDGLEDFYEVTLQDSDKLDEIRASIRSLRKRIELPREQK